MRRAEQSGRRDAARAALRALEETAAEADRAGERLAAAERAAVCAPLLGVLDQAVRAAASAADARDQALSQVASALGDTDVEQLDASALADRAGTLRSRSTRLEALLPREAAGRSAEHQLAAARAELAAAEEELAETDPSGRRAARRDRRPDRPARRRGLPGRAAARRSTSRWPQPAVGTRRPTGLAAATDGVARLADAHRDARDRSLDRPGAPPGARGQASGRDGRRARRQPARGGPCQVCGSTSHPAPAEPAHDAVGAEDQESAEAQVAAARQRWRRRPPPCATPSTAATPAWRTPKDAPPVRPPPRCAR